MNPQDTPNTETPKTADPTTPASPPETPAAPAAPNLASNTVPAPTPSPVMPQPPVKQSRKKMLLTTVIPIVVFIAFITLLIVLPRYKSIKLETYSNDKYSLLVPKDYDKTDEADGYVTFEEKGKDAGTKSRVEVDREDFPEKVTDAAAQKDALDSVETSFKDSLNDAAKQDNNTVEDYKSEDGTFKGNKSRTITATVKNKGNTAGRVKVVIALNDTSLFLVAVEAHISDRGITNDTDKIINSFELK